MLYGAVIPMGLFGLAHVLLTRGEKESKQAVELSDEFGDSMIS
jgi:hypothetical protein